LILAQERILFTSFTHASQNKGKKQPKS